ncbi:Methylosome protein 50 [Nymphon striatum]|nr:Methylosome protein 50 [Nymphon striatum]
MLAGRDFPGMINQHINALAISDEGNLLVGSSNLIGRSWIATVCLFNEADKCDNHENYDGGQDLDSAIIDVKFVDSDKFICCFDSGAIQMFKIGSEPPITFTSVFYRCIHDSLVSSISISSTKKFLISSGYDMSIKLWDIEVNNFVKAYDCAHSDRIHSVCCHPTDDNIFLSCSQDNSLKMWDTRKEKPATNLGKLCGNGVPTSVRWSLNNYDKIFIGNDAGELILANISDKKFISSSVHRRPINNLEISPFNPNLIASCCDGNLVSVIDSSDNSLKSIYKDTRHQDFVRGLAWNPVNKKLYSGGWDKQIFSHQIESEEMSINNDK